MKLIKPSFEILEQGGYTLDDIYKHIELCGRTCYKSTDKITDDSAKPFVERMIASKHYAMLEHGTIYLYINRVSPLADDNYLAKVDSVNHYATNKYSKVVEKCDDGYHVRYYITTNYRVIVENGWLEDLQYICNPTEYHEKRYTVKFICNRQVSHEFVRHRVFSFAQESTRYCNYTKGKFGNELTFIKPNWVENKDTTETSYGCLVSLLQEIERQYHILIGEGWKPQEAATILPNALKTELIMTGFASDWKHFFDLRALGTTGAPHPQAKELALPLMEEFTKRNYI